MSAVGTRVRLGGLSVFFIEEENIKNGLAKK